MSNTQHLLNKINSFSSDPEIRKTGRIDSIKEFREKALQRDKSFTTDVLLNGRLFPHELDADALREFIAFAHFNLDNDDFHHWVEHSVIKAINDQSFVKAKILMDVNPLEAIELNIHSFPVLTMEMLSFLESESKSNLLKIKPFLNMNWRNGAGHEGFILLHRLVGADRLKQHILADHHYEIDDNDYSPLGLLAEMGLLDDFLDRETTNILIARGFMSLLGDSPDESIIRDVVYRLDSGRLLEAFATESKYGNASKVTEAMKVIIPYLTTANQQR